MIFTESARRLSACGIGIVAAAAVTVACSSSTAGTADTSAAGPPPGDNSTSVSVSLPASLSASVPASLPVSLPASLPASIPTLGGSQFCKDLSGLGNIGNSLSGGATGKLNSFLSGLDKIVGRGTAGDQAGPADPRRLCARSAERATPTPLLAQKLPTIEQHLIAYIAANCHG